MEKEAKQIISHLKYCIGEIIDCNEQYEKEKATLDQLFNAKRSCILQSIRECDNRAFIEAVELKVNDDTSGNPRRNSVWVLISALRKINEDSKLVSEWIDDTEMLNTIRDGLDSALSDYFYEKECDEEREIMARDAEIQRQAERLMSED